MQFCFCPGEGNTELIFIIGLVQEWAENKELMIVFVDLEKPFDRVPWEMLPWALRKVGVNEWTTY